jgi:FkbM family methyltransferase
MKISRQIGERGLVIAIEACPVAYSLLVRNIEENALTNIRPVHAALQDVDGTIALFQSERQNNSIHSTLKDQKLNSDMEYADSATVPARMLDTILEETEYPLESMNTLVSFEINGAEVLALRGADKFLNLCPRFDLRIAARYGAAGDGVPKEQILRLLAEYPDIVAVDHEPFVIAYKYPTRTVCRIEGVPATVLCSK